MQTFETYPPSNNYKEILLSRYERQNNATYSIGGRFRFSGVTSFVNLGDIKLKTNKSVYTGKKIVQFMITSSEDVNMKTQVDKMYYFDWNELKKHVFILTEEIAMDRSLDKAIKSLW